MQRDLQTSTNAVGYRRPRQSPPLRSHQARGEVLGAVLELLRHTWKMDNGFHVLKGTWSEMLSLRTQKVLQVFA